MTSTGLMDALSTSDGPERRLWATLATHVFVRLDTTHTFHRDHPLVVLKTRELIDHAPLVEHQLGPFQFCRMAMITCGGVPCAYVLTTPQCRMRVRTHYCAWSRRGDHVRLPSPLYTDGTLGMVGDEGAIVAFVHRRHWIT